eukprot:3652745-Prymnesium_polylepis.1
MMQPMGSILRSGVSWTPSPTAAISTKVVCSNNIHFWALPFRPRITWVDRSSAGSMGNCPKSRNSLQVRRVASFSHQPLVA